MYVLGHCMKVVYRYSL